MKTGNDIPGIIFQVNNEDGSPFDFTIFDQIELTLQDKFGVVKASYFKTDAPDSDHLIDMTTAGQLKINIHREDSVNFEPGAMFIEALCIKDSYDGYMNGYHAIFSAFLDYVTK